LLPSAEAQVGQLRVTSLTLTNHNVTIHWEGGNADFPYQLQKQPDLSGDWFDVGLPVFGSDGSNALSDPNAFYRVSQPNIGAVSASFDQDPPSEPTGLTSYAASCGQVVIYWNASTDNPGGSGINAYYIYRDGAFLKSAPSWATSTFDEGLLSPSNSYTYTILAIDAAQNVSAFSSPAIVTTPACADPTAPSAPTGLTATATSDLVVHLTWTASTDASGSSIMGYNLYRNGRFLVQVPGFVTSATDSNGIAARTTYSYAVSAVNGATSQSAQSGPANATTPLKSTGSDKAPPTVPSGLALSATACNQVLLSWNASTDLGTRIGGTTYTSGLKGYNIYRGGIFLKQVLAPATSTTDSNVIGATAYSYAIAATDNAGNTSSIGAPAMVTTPACQSCTATVIASSSPGAGGTASSGGTVNCGSSVTVTASPNAGYYFANWTENGTVVSTSAIYTFTANANRNLVANFTAAAYSINTSSSPQGAGTTSGDGTLTSGSVATVTASSNVGYDFANWTENGTVVSTSSNYTFTVNANRSLVANFVVAPCAYFILPGGAFFNSSGGSDTISMIAGSSCSWNASTTNSWIHTGSSNMGSGTVNYSVDVNEGPGSRLGAILVRGQTFAITQADPSCSYSLSTNNAAYASGVWSGAVNLSTSNGCTWTAFSRASWISLTGPVNGSGNATVTYAVSGNGSANSRVGTFGVAGLTFTVTQSGNQPPVANAGPGQSSTAGSMVNLSGSGSSDPDGNIISYRWNFGDGTTASGISVAHIYAAAGTYTVVLTVTDNLGAAASGTAIIVVTGSSAPPLTVTLTSPGAGNTISNTVTFAVTASANVTRVEFYADNNTFPLGFSTASPYSTQVVTTGMSNGSHTFYAKAYDSAGNSTNSQSVIVTVNNIIPGQSSWVARSQGGSTNDSADSYGLAIDQDGSSIVAGWFNGALDFGSGLMTTIGIQDAFLAKFSSSGTNLWSRQFGGVMAQATGVAVDKATHSIFVVGYYKNTIDFGGITLSNSGPAAIYLAKFSLEGNVLWVKGFAGTGRLGNAVALDFHGDVIIAGSIPQTFAEIDLGGGMWTTVGQQDIFVAKFSGANGSYLWSHHFGSVQAANNARTVAVDNNGDVLLAGSFEKSIDFGGGPYTSAGDQDIFLAKFSGTDGSYRWSNRFGSTNADTALALTSNPNSQVLITGTCRGPIDLGGGLFLADAGIFVAKYDLNGVLIWAKLFQSTANSLSANGIAVDQGGNVLLTGGVKGTVDFGGGDTAQGSSASDIFLAKLSPSGGFVWSKHFQALSDPHNDDLGRSVAVDTQGNVLATGSFSADVDFGGLSLSSSGSSEVFLIKLSP